MKEKEGELPGTTQKMRDLIANIAVMAGEDWSERRICLPSLTMAIILEGIASRAISERKLWSRLFPRWKEWDGGHCFSLGQAIRLHNDYLALWKAENQTLPNWNRLIGETNYIRAVQYLQDAEYPYCQEKEYESLLINVIEKCGLEKLDHQHTVFSQK